MIYFDYAATTPCDPIVLEEIIPYFTKIYANPSNVSHRMGQDAGKAVQIARNTLSEHLNCLPQQIVWTSGATESNNLALNGTIKSYLKKFPGKIPHIITSSIEHKSILEPLVNYPDKIDVTYIKPGSGGMISPQDIRDNIHDNTILVSIMAANNEIGTINDIESISKICQEEHIIFHTDASQYFGKLLFDLGRIRVDLMSFSGHKLYAPKGIGGLFIRNYSLVKPMLLGGGQENGLRSGTLNVPGIIGIVKAYDLCMIQQNVEYMRIANLRDTLEKLILSEHPTAQINGYGTSRLANISNISFPVKNGYNLLNILMEKRVVACSSGSACDTPDNNPSHVLTELGKTRHESKNTLRFSLGRYSTEEEVKKVATHIIQILNQIYTE